MRLEKRKKLKSNESELKEMKSSLDASIQKSEALQKKVDDLNAKIFYAVEEKKGMLGTKYQFGNDTFKSEHEANVAKEMVAREIETTAAELDKCQNEIDTLQFKIESLETEIKELK